MDGAKPLRSRIDLDEDGKIDRWEYYDDQGKLAKVGFSRNNNGKADAWGYPDPNGGIPRTEISSTRDANKTDRPQHLTPAPPPRLQEHPHHRSRACRRADAGAGGSPEARSRWWRSGYRAAPAPCSSSRR